jgi:hypothetical protein
LTYLLSWRMGILPTRSSSQTERRETT